MPISTSGLYAGRDKQKDDIELEIRSQIAAQQAAYAQKAADAEAKLKEEREGKITSALDIQREEARRLRESPQQTDVQRINLSNADVLASRAQMGQALGLQQAAAMGNAPSAAQVQMQMGLDAAVRNQMAGAASGRGGFNPGALRYAQAQGAQMSQMGVQQAAQLRAQEMAAARDAYMAGAAGLSQRDIGLSQQQAGMDLTVGQYRDAFQQQQQQRADALNQSYLGSMLAIRSGDMNAIIEQQKIKAQQDAAYAQAAAQERAATIGAFGTVIGAGAGMFGGK